MDYFLLCFTENPSEIRIKGFNQSDFSIIHQLLFTPFDSIQLVSPFEHFENISGTVDIVCGIQINFLADFYCSGLAKQQLPEFFHYLEGLFKKFQVYFSSF